MSAVVALVALYALAVFLIVGVLALSASSDLVAERVHANRDEDLRIQAARDALR